MLLLVTIRHRGNVISRRLCDSKQAKALCNLFHGTAFTTNSREV